MNINGLSEESDPLDSENYDPVVHLNQIFSHPSTLTSVSQTHTILEAYQDDLDDEIDLLEEAQDRVNAECLARMEASKLELAELLEQIEGVRNRALQTERNITEMTADIKQLDNTKKNLTLSMTALKRLQMLTTAYDQLRVLIKTKQYRECAQLLQAVIQLMAYFKSYRSIDQIAVLSRNVAELQREVLEQICEDFEVTFAKEEVPSKRGMLYEACMVVDALGEAARSRLVTWYCNTELRQYRTIFRGDQEAGSLDNIDRRYAWFRKLLKVHDEEHAALFPEHWQVGSILAHVFAENTREDYRGILSRSTRNGQTLDVKLLLSCLQQTLDFEQALERKFSNSSRISIDTTASVSDNESHKILISDAFEPYLGLWVEQQDRELARMMQEYKSRPARPPDEDFNPEHVISSSTELIKFYQMSLIQCAKLSTGQPLFDLSKVFAKYFDQYSQSVLLAYISEKPTGNTPSRQPALEDIIVTLNTADYCNLTSNQLSDKVRARADPSFVDAIDFTPQSDAFMGIASTCIRALVRLVETDIEPFWREMRNIPYGKIESCSNTSSYIPGLKSRLKIQSDRIMAYLHKPQYSRAFVDNLVELLSHHYLLNITQCKPISSAGAEQMLLDTHELRSALSNILPSPQPSLFLKRVTTTFNRIEPLLKTLQVTPDPPEALVQAYLIHIADLSDANFRKVLDLKGIRGKNETAQLLELYQMHKLSPRYSGSLVEKSPILTPLLGGTNLAVSSATPSSIQGTSTPNATMSNLQSLGSSAAASLSTANLPSNLNLNLPNLKFADAAGGIGNAIMDRFTSSSSPQPRQLEGITSPTPVRNNSLPAPSLLVTPARSSEETTSNATVGITVGGGANGVTTTNGDSSPATSDSTPLPIPQQQGKLNENLKSIGKFFKRDTGGSGGTGTGTATGGGGGGTFSFGRFGRGQSPAPVPAPTQGEK